MLWCCPFVHCHFMHKLQDALKIAHTLDNMVHLLCINFQTYCKNYRRQYHNALPGDLSKEAEDQTGLSFPESFLRCQTTPLVLGLHPCSMVQCSVKQTAVPNHELQQGTSSIITSCRNARHAQHCLCPSQALPEWFRLAPAAVL